jgi:hypothetical protein
MTRNSHHKLENIYKRLILASVIILNINLNITSSFCDFQHRAEK